MTAWVIVPRGQGDLAERVGASADLNPLLEVTLFLDERAAHLMLDRFKPQERERAEVREVEVTLK